jgi:hypothetical protein
MAVLKAPARSWLPLAETQLLSALSMSTFSHRKVPLSSLVVGVAQLGDASFGLLYTIIRTSLGHYEQYSDGVGYIYTYDPGVRRRSYLYALRSIASIGPAPYRDGCRACHV